MLTGTGAVMSAQGPGWAPVLEVRADLAGPTGDRTATSGSWPLVAGQPVSSAIVASSDLCSLGGGQEGPSRSSRAENLWRFTASLVSADAKGYRIRFNSQFEHFAAGAPPAPSTDELVLKEGGDVTLETLRATTDGPCHIRNVTIRVRVVLRAVDPVAQAARYAADVWLIHTDAAGVERRQHVALTLDGTGPTPLTFEPLGFPLPLLNPNQGDLEAFLQLAGSLRARVRPDGQIDVDVATIRSLALRHPSDAPHDVRGASGMKTLTVKEDEAVAIDLPAATGMAILALTPEARFDVGAGVRSGATPGPPPSSTPAVSVVNDRMTIVFDEFFKGHKTQLLIRLRKARE
jgi:hypothetical protein